MIATSEYDADTLHLMRHWEREYRRNNGGRASAEFLAACKGVHPGDVARALGPVRLTGAAVVKLMRQQRVTIGFLKAKTGITKKRIREIREGGITGSLLTDAYVIRDWIEAITGTDPGAALDHPAVEMV